MAGPYRNTVTIDGTSFGAVSTNVQFTTDKDRSGVPQMGSLDTVIRVWADMHDINNLPFSAVKKFFDMSNVVTNDKIKSIKIEYWKDDSHQDALCSYKFNGWISRFETSNPISLSGLSDEIEAEFRSLTPELNHVMVLDIVPAMNQQNFQSIQMSN